MNNDLTVDNEIFIGETVSKVAVLKIKDNSLSQLANLNVKEKLFDCLNAINNSEDIRVILFLGSTLKTECKEYIELFRKILQTGRGRNCQIYGLETNALVEHMGLARFCNAVNQLVLKIVQLNKFVIHADSGVIISPFMNLSLACDYRIVAANSHFKNPYLDLGLVPKGGSAVFLSRLLGFQKAYQILLSDDGISANEALQVGIVDEVVPSTDLLHRALEVARSYAELPAASISGIKKLMNVSIRELEDCLESENELIFRATKSDMFREKMNTYISGGREMH